MNSLLGKCIGVGGCSEVFEWGNDRAIKLFRSNTDEYAVEREYNNMVVAWENGIPTYKPYEKVKVNGQLGIIYERIEGQTLMERFLQGNVGLNNIKGPLTEKDKSLLDYKDNDVRITARILYDIHKKSISGIPDQKETLKHRISRAAYLNEEEKQSIYEIVDSLPSKNLFCHGDPNPGNFIIRNGKPVIIDWMNATMGDPAADIAEYIVMMKYSILPPKTPNSFVEFFNVIREFTIEIFLDEYMKLSDIKYEEIHQWMVPVIAGKLSADAISDEEKKVLVKVIREKLKNS